LAAQFRLLCSSKLGYSMASILPAN
jgi:hypothetical protein